MKALALASLCPWIQGLGLSELRRAYQEGKRARELPQDVGFGASGLRHY